MKHLSTISAALFGAAAMLVAQPTIFTSQAAAPTPCAPAPKVTVAVKATATPVATPTVANVSGLTFSGSGNKVVDIKRDDKLKVAIVRITGNAGGRFFAVIGYDADGEQTDLLVNTTDKYDGLRPLGWTNEKVTTRLEVKATGKWTIEILPISSARKLTVPGKIDGAGDDVVLLSGAKPDLIRVNGNSASRYFGVIAYDDSSWDAVVNTTEPYEGESTISAKAVALEVKATGKWSVEVTSK